MEKELIVVLMKIQIVLTNKNFEERIKVLLNRIKYHITNIPIKEYILQNKEALIFLLLFFQLLKHYDGVF